MKKKKKPSFSDLVDLAFKQAGLDAVKRARQTGTPLIVWERGAMRAIPSDELERKTRKPRKRRNKGQSEKR